MNTRPTCTILGAGNVAWSLAIALKKAGIEVSQIWSRTPEKTATLAEKVGAEAVDVLDMIRPGADIYIISVHDDAIASLARRLSGFGGTWVHTSGSIDADTLKPITPTYGVLYPLQTFTVGRETPLDDVPVYIEGSDEQTAGFIGQIAQRISHNVKRVDSRGRRRVHAAAVFACNFTNHMWAIADRLLRRNGDDLSVLYPLIGETTRKIMEMSPADAQTGPARRGDRRVIANHIHALDADEARVYAAVSDSIMKDYGHELD